MAADQSLGNFRLTNFWSDQSGSIRDFRFVNHQGGLSMPERNAPYKKTRLDVAGQPLLLFTITFLFR
jgi:hypothetical protein